MKSIKSKAISGLFWQGLNVFLFSLMNIVFLMGMARMVEKESHGIFVVVSAIIIFVGMISQAGIGYGLIQRKENSPRDISFAFYGSFLLGAVFCLLMWICSPLISSIYGELYDPLYLGVASISLLFINLGSVSRSLLIKELRFKEMFFVQCGSYLVGNLMVGFWMAYHAYDIWAFVVGLVLFNGIGFIGYFIARPHSLKFDFSKKELKDTWYFSSSFTLSEILNNAGHFVDKLILGGIVSPTILAIYEKGQQTSRLPIRVIGNTFDTVFYSLLTHIQDQEQRIKQLYLNIQGVSVFLTMVLLSILLLYAKHVVIILLGANWIDSIPVMQAFALPFSLAIIAKHADVIFRVKNRLFLASRIKLIFLLMVLVAVFLSRTSPIAQISWAISIAFVVFYIIYIYYSLSILRINLATFWSSIKHGLVSGSVFFLVNYLLMLVLEGNLGRVVSLIVVFLFDGLLLLLLIRFRPQFLGKENLAFLGELLAVVHFHKIVADWCPFIFRLLKR